MAGPTKDELAGEIAVRLRELEQTSQGFRAFAETALKHHEVQLADSRKIEDQLQARVLEHSTKIASIEERCKSLEKLSDRAWGITQAITVALLSLLGGAVLTLIIQLSLKK